MAALQETNELLDLLDKLNASKREFQLGPRRERVEGAVQGGFVSGFGKPGGPRTIKARRQGTGFGMIERLMRQLFKKALFPKAQAPGSG